MSSFPPYPHRLLRHLERLPSWSLLLVPLAFGLLSVVLGQDANWDLQNYHRYNPWAFLTDRVGHDLAPAGMQSYFNPLIDLPYHGMTAVLPPRVAGFLMGTLHGLNFLLLWGICREALPAGTSRRTPVWLALAGCLGATFLSGIGNTMGDSATALLVLGAVWLPLRAWDVLAAGGRRGAVVGLATGMLVGLGVGLKLTNATYAVGLAVAMAWALRGWARPHRGPAAVAVLGLGVGGLLGIAVTAGFWFASMWQQFGNPLFPQFNALFHSDMARESMVGDTRWWPRGPAEWLLWPLVFTLQPQRFGEVTMVQLLWPVVYGLFGLWLLRTAWSRLPFGAGRLLAPPVSGRLPARMRFVLAFLAASYLAWIVVFSIGRYVVAMELLLPLATWILWHRLAAPRTARRLAIGCIAVAALVSVTRLTTWGHAGWTDRYYTVPVPPIAQPERSALLVLSLPAAWVLPDFPPEMVFVSFGNVGLPESDAYWRRVDTILADRPGPVYALVTAGRDPRVENIEERLNRWTAERGIRVGSLGCRAIAWGLHQVPDYRRVEPAPGAVPGACAFAMPADQRRNLPAQDRTYALRASEDIAARGLSIDPADCAPLRAYIGTKPFAFQLCTVGRVPKPSPGRSPAG